MDFPILLGWTIHIVSFVAALLIPIVYVYMTGKTRKGVFLGWGAMVMWIFVLSIFVPGIMSSIYPEYKQAFFGEVFPESIGILPIALIGWVNGLILAGIGLGARKIMARLKTKYSNQS